MVSVKLRSSPRNIGLMIMFSVCITRITAAKRSWKSVIRIGRVFEACGGRPTKPPEKVFIPIVTRTLGWLNNINLGKSEEIYQARFEAPAAFRTQQDRQRRAVGGRAGGWGGGRLPMRWEACWLGRSTDIK